MERSCPPVMNPTDDEREGFARLRSVAETASALARLELRLRGWS